MSDLPKGWAECQLGDVVKIQNGYAFPSKDFQREGIPLIKQSNLAGDKISLEKCVYLDPKYLTLKPDYVLKRNDVLIGMSGSIGKLCIYDSDEPALQNQRTGKIVLLAKEKISWRFIWEYLKTIEIQLLEKGKGLGVINVSATDIESLTLKLPPLNEQKRIVEKLEKLLGKVEAVQARLDKIPAILKGFRQAILSAACSGKLTEDWRNVNHSSSIATLISQLETSEPESHFNTFEQSKSEDVPQNWIWVKLGKLGQMVGGGTPSKENPKFWKGKIPWVSPKDMKRDRICDSIDHITELAINNSSVKFIPKGSILFVVRGMILNHTLPTAITDTDITLNQDMKAIIPEISEMSEYLFLASKHIAKSILFEVKEATHGTRRIETQLLKNWAVPIPPLKEQKEIVRRVEDLFKFADQIEVRYKKARSYTDKLTQSILAKAFRGELVPQDSADEPASVLLAKIKTEKETNQTKASTKRKTVSQAGLFE